MASFDPFRPRAKTQADEETYLRELLADLGAQAGAYRYEVAPNPCVGAAVLSDGVEIGRGFHRAWGGPHAEVQALRAAEASGLDRSLWDTLVCTLEPCSTTGKTGPCVDAVVASGVRRVVVGEVDPDPRHRGRGLELLRERGLEVVHLHQASPLHRVAPYFLAWNEPDRLRRPRPWILAKWAQTRTGQLTPPEDVGEGRWISSLGALEDVHWLRSHVDAIVTGVGTVLSDDPRLTVRGAPAELCERPPLRVVLDSDLRLPLGARLFEPEQAGERAGELHVFTRTGADPAWRRRVSETGAVVHAERPGDDGRPSPRAILDTLHGMGVRRVLLEAGPRLLESWFEKRLIDQVRVYTGNINGGRGPNLGEYLDPRRLIEMQHSEVGDDARLDAFLPR